MERRLGIDWEHAPDDVYEENDEIDDIIGAAAISD